MALRVGCTLEYEVLSPTASFTFNVLVNVDPRQQLLRERLLCRPEVSHERVTTSKGNRVFRVELPAGPFVLDYSAEVAVMRPTLPADVPADSPGRLPLSVLTYTLPSRYCESDRFGPAAWELFGRIGNRVEQVREICRWVDANLEYAPGATDSRTSAWDVWGTRKGVCRDYSHLCIALCRALSIPARYLGAFAVGLSPMDFHACFEAYLGGQWYLFDPTDGIAPEKIVVIARGRDAANAPFTPIYGRVFPGRVSVFAEEVPPAPPPAPDVAPGIAGA